MIVAGLFDMDGLLIDSEPLWQQAEIEVFGSPSASFSRALHASRREVDASMRSSVIGSRDLRGRALLAGKCAAAIVGRVIELVAAEGSAKPGVRHALDFFAARGLAPPRQHP